MLRKLIFPKITGQYCRLCMGAGTVSVGDETVGCSACGGRGRLPPLDIAETLISTLNPPPNEGITYQQMAVRMPIAAKLKAASDFVLLEEGEWKELKEGVERTQWVRLDEDLYAICQAVMAAAEIDAQELVRASESHSSESELVTVDEGH